MEAILIIPDSDARKALAAKKRSRLTWTTNHPMSSYGLGVLLYSNGGMLDGLSFMTLRDLLGAVIETSDVKRVRGALGIPATESGIVEVGGGQP